MGGQKVDDHLGIQRALGRYLLLKGSLFSLHLNAGLFVRPWVDGKTKIRL